MLAGSGRQAVRQLSLNFKRDFGAGKPWTKKWTVIHPAEITGSNWEPVEPFFSKFFSQPPYFGAASEILDGVDP